MIMGFFFYDKLFSGAVCVTSQFFFNLSWVLDRQRVMALSYMRCFVITLLPVYFTNVTEYDCFKAVDA